MNRLKIKPSDVAYALCAIVFIYLLLSVADISLHNYLLGPKQYAWWNLFEILLG